MADPRRVFNGDETGFLLDPNSNSVIAMRGDKNVYQVKLSDSKKMITVLYTFCADGFACPPCVVLPYKRIPCQVARSFSDEWGVAKSERGWMTQEVFLEFITNVFIPYLEECNIQKPVIYFLDGHSSHTGWRTAQACLNVGVILISLYANSTHILQPADVAIFRPLKTCWGKEVASWKELHPGQGVNINNFGFILKAAMKSAFKESTIRNGFRVCGLFPFDPEAVDYTKCVSTKVHKERRAASDPTSANVEQDTVPVKFAHAQETIKKLGVQRIALFRSVGLSAITSSHEQILYDVYNKILAPYDQTSLDGIEILVQEERDEAVDEP